MKRIHIKTRFLKQSVRGVSYILTCLILLLPTSGDPACSHNKSLFAVQYIYSLGTINYSRFLLVKGRTRLLYKLHFFTLDDLKDLTALS